MDRIKWEISSELDRQKPELLPAWTYYWCNLGRKFLWVDSCDGAIIPLRALQQGLLTQGPWSNLETTAVLSTILMVLNTFCL